MSFVTLQNERINRPGLKQGNYPPEQPGRVLYVTACSRGHKLCDAL